MKPCMSFSGIASHTVPARYPSFSPHVIDSAIVANAVSGNAPRGCANTKDPDYGGGSSWSSWYKLT